MHAGTSMPVPATCYQFVAIALPQRFLLLRLRLWGAFEHSDQFGSGVAALLSGFDELGDLGEY